MKQISIKKCFFASLYLVMFTGILIAQNATPKSVPNTNVNAYYKDNFLSNVNLPYETEEEYLTRMQWWKDAKYGMFIHWGLYSYLAGEYKGETTPKIAEWIQNTLKIPLKDYQKSKNHFKASKFNADSWAKLAKEAGMKYVVLTSKHHDGFAMFDSKVSEYDIMNTPYKKDVVKELKEACHKQGLKFGLYYSHVIDWEHPHAFVGKGKLTDRMNTVDYDLDKMNRSIYHKEKAFPQLKEILTNYGAIDILWFDMGKGLTKDEVAKFVKITRELQPNIIISSRVGEEAAPRKVISREMMFDYYTPSDNYFTGDDLDMPWEMAGTTNESWGFRKDDDNWRTPFQMLNSLISSISRGGNYLLNVGPKENGLIPSKVVKNLKKVGEWLAKNKEAVYETTATSFPWNYSWGYCTEKVNKIYLHIFNTPENNKIELNGVLNKVNTVYNLSTGENVEFKQEGRFLSIPVTCLKKKDLATVYVVKYAGDNLRIAKNISQNLDNTIRLDRIASKYIDDLLFSSWSFKVHTPGTYKINLVSNEKGSHSHPSWTGAEQTGSVSVDGKSFPVVLKKDEEKINPSLFFFKTITSHLGKVKFDRPGTYTLHLKGFKIGAGKWQKGLGLDRIDLIPTIE